MKRPKLVFIFLVLTVVNAQSASCHEGYEGTVPRLANPREEVKAGERTWVDAKNDYVSMSPRQKVDYMDKALRGEIEGVTVDPSAPIRNLTSYEQRLFNLVERELQDSVGGYNRAYAKVAFIKGAEGDIWSMHVYMSRPGQRRETSIATYTYHHGKLTRVKGMPNESNSSIDI